MRRVYVDANVFLYAVGAGSRYRGPCRDFLNAAWDGRVAAETSALTLQEVVHHRRRRGDRQATAHGRDVMHMCAAVHPVDGEIALDALRLVDDHPRLEAADAIHVATAIATGSTVVLSADDDFDEVAGITRVDPLDGSSLARLLSE